MDPLTLTTGILALLRASASLSSTLLKLRRLKDAPGLVQALNNEISDLRLILIHINDYHESIRTEGLCLPNNDNPISDLCSSTLDQTRDKVQEVENLLRDKLLKSPEGSDLKVNRLAFMRERDHLIQLQADLRIGRQKIANLFGQLGIKNISNIEVLLNDIRSNDLSTLLQSQIRIEDALDRIEERQLLPLSPGRRPIQPTLPPGPDNTDASSIEVSISPLISHISRSKCTCHQRSASIKLHNLLGSLFVGYVATPANYFRRGCPHQRRIELQLIYIFPTWFIKYALSLKARFDMHGTITCSLSVNQIISSDHIVWVLIKLGDLAGIKRLLNAGQISIRAQNARNQSLVTLSILQGQAAVTRFLIEMGADVDIGMKFSLVHQKLAWDRILKGARSSQWRDEMRALFPDPDLEELYGFSVLHKAVLGLNSRSIEDILSAEPTLIDKIDYDSKTALTWAAWRGDGGSVGTLLSHGSDPNKADHIARSPLDYAVMVDVECASKLLEAGADVNSRSAQGFAPLQTAVSSSILSEKDCVTQMLDLLIQAGAEVNVTDGLGDTPLRQVEHEDEVTTAEYLIRNGADPGICNISGSNIFSHATQINCHSLIALLIREHQDHTGWIEHEATFMHLAASYADAERLQMLSHGNLKRRDINVKNGTGLTPCQVGLQRENVDAEWRHAFFDFLRSIDQDSPLPPERVSEVQEVSEETTVLDRDPDIASVGDSEGSQSDGDFEDAVEVQG